MKKMNFKKVIACVVALAVTCSMLTGCVGANGNVKFNADGSGSITLKAGFSESAMKIIDSMGGQNDLDENKRQEFTYNGVKYIGSVASMDFKVPEEFNSFMVENTDSEDIGVGVGMFNLDKNPDGTLGLTITVDESTGDTSSVEEQMSSEELGLSKEIIDGLMAEMSLVYTFEFPFEVRQTGGEMSGITVSGNEVVVDILKLAEALNGRSDVLTFTAGLPSLIKPVVGNYIFSDVTVSDWFCAAVNALASGGLVQGVGNNMFSPESTLTYAQFCQILARAQGLEKGEQDGYWAYKAIKACREKGYIADLGLYTPENYDVPMPREAAVAGMFRAKAGELLADGKIGALVTDKDIPDFEAIGSTYKNDIVNAYNSGITNGIDGNRTFNPKGLLTRAEICQLFFNLDWTVPDK